MVQLAEQDLVADRAQEQAGGRSVRVTGEPVDQGREGGIVLCPLHDQVVGAVGAGGAQRPGEGDVPVNLVDSEVIVGAVSLERTADREAEVLRVELVDGPRTVAAVEVVERRRGQILGHAVIAEEGEGRTLHLVGAGLRDHVDEGAAVAAVLGREAVGDDLELAHGVLSDDQPVVLRRLAAAAVAEEGALVVGAVNGETAVHAALAGDGQEAALAVALHARSQDGEVGEVAADDRQALDLDFVDVVRGAGAAGFDDRRLGGDRDHLGRRLDRQRQVDVLDLADQDRDVGLLGRLHAGEFGGHGVGADLQRLGAVEAVRIGDDGPVDAGVLVGRRNCRAGNRVTGDIGDVALDGAVDGLGHTGAGHEEGAGRCQEDRKKTCPGPGPLHGRCSPLLLVECRRTQL